MVLVPWDRDQPGVAARAERLGVAAVVPRTQFDLAHVAGAISSVLEDAELRATSKQTAARLQSVDAVDVACHFLERL